jgi:predicted nucleic acid-binding protein
LHPLRSRTGFRSYHQPQRFRRLGKFATVSTEDLGKAAGAICGHTGTTDVIDALVAVTALRLHALVVTNDPDDLQHLASSLHSKLAIFTV